MANHIGVIGAGVMGEALIAALIRSGVSPRDITFAEKRSERAQELTARYGISQQELADLGAHSSIILLVVKPQDMATTLADLAPSISESALVISFAAGKNYVLRILISTYDVNQSMSNYGLGFGLTTTAGTASISTSYVVMNGSQYSAGNRTYISVVADVVLNGTSNADAYSLVVTLTSGANGGASISANGSFTRIEVGSIG